MIKKAIEDEISKLEAASKQLVANANANAGALQAFRHILKLIEAEENNGENPTDPVT